MTDKTRLLRDFSLKNLWQSTMEAIKKIIIQNWYRMQQLFRQVFKEGHADTLLSFIKRIAI